MAMPSSPELQAFLQHLAVQRRLAERTLAMYAEALVRLERLAALRRQTPAAGRQLDVATLIQEGREPR